MKKKTKAGMIVLGCIALIAIVGYLIIGNPMVFINNQKLENAIKTVSNETVQLNDVVPFEWDTLYTFSPYQNKESIEEMVGFKSADIRENNINEGMVHLLFVKNNNVVASILGYSNNLGYNIAFTSQVTFAENVQFNVSRTDGITTLSYS